jgi:hypothetical protein
MIRKFQQAYHIPGTLAADINIRFTAPSDCKILHVSAVASNDSDATLKIGTSSDDDEFLTASTIGDSNTPEEFELADFVDDEFPRIEDGDVVIFTLDHDGAGGTAAQNVTIVATLAEG